MAGKIIGIGAVGLTVLYLDRPDLLMQLSIR